MNKPVTILTGFLGAGKTTYLNHLLQQNKGVRYAIVENEFGEQGIDNELVIRGDESIVELNNGCLCCTLNDNLYDILNELHDRQEEFDEVIIEATGVADPTGLAQPFIVHSLIKKHFPLTSIICLVDVELIEDQLLETKEAYNQIAYSDIIILNKIDLVNEDYVETTAHRVQSINPLAKVFRGHRQNFPNIPFSQSANEQLENLLLKENHHTHHQADQKFPVSKPHSHHHHDHTQEINSLTFTFERPFDMDKLQHNLFVYLTFQSEGLYRIKGLIWVEGENDQYILQSVGKRFDIDKKRLWKSEEIKQSVLVFIGKNLPHPGLDNLLRRCLVHEEKVKMQHVESK